MRRDWSEACRFCSRSENAHSRRAFLPASKANSHQGRFWRLLSRIDLLGAWSCVKKGLHQQLGAHKAQNEHGQNPYSKPEPAQISPPKSAQTMHRFRTVRKAARVEFFIAIAQAPGYGPTNRAGAHIMRITPEEALKKAIAILGGTAAVAAIIGTSHQYVSQMKRCPPGRVDEITEALRRAKERTRNAPTARQLCPSLYSKKKKPKRFP